MKKIILSLTLATLAQTGTVYAQNDSIPTDLVVDNSESGPQLPSLSEKLDQSSFPNSNLLMMSAFMRGGGGMSPLINCQTGNCSFDIPTITNTQLLGYLNKTQDITRTRYIQLIEESRKSMNDVVTTIFSKGPQKGLFTLAIESKSAMSPLSSDEVFKAYSAYKEKYVQATTNFQVLSSFFDGKIEGIPLNDRNVLAKEMPTVVQANLDLVAKKFQAGLKGIATMIAQQDFNVLLPTGEIVGTQTGNGKIFQIDPITGELFLVINARGQQASQETMDGLRAKIKELNTKPASLIAAAEALGKTTRTYIASFIEELGAKSSWSTTFYSYAPDWVAGGAKGSNKAVAGTLKTHYDNLIRVFWVRSALRLYHGTLVGAFDINYESSPDQTDLFKTRSKTLSDLPEELIYTQDGIDAIYLETDKKYRLALNTSGSKSIIANNSAKDKAGNDGIGGKTIAGTANQYNDATLLDGNFGVVDYMNSAWTAIQHGDVQQWKILHLVLKLMAADFYEEELLNQFGGLRRMNSFYQARYVDIPEDEASRFNEPELLNSITGTESSDGLTVDGDQSEGSLVGQTNTLVQELDKYTSNRGQAKVLQTTLDFYLGKFTMETFKKHQQRAKLLSRQVNNN